MPEIKTMCITATWIKKEGKICQKKENFLEQCTVILNFMFGQKATSAPCKLQMEIRETQLILLPYLLAHVVAYFYTYLHT